MWRLLQDIWEGRLGTLAVTQRCAHLRVQARVARVPHEGVLKQFSVQTFWYMHAKFLNRVACLFDKDRPKPSMNGTGMKLGTVRPHWVPVFVIGHTGQQTICYWNRPTAIAILRFVPYIHCVKKRSHICTGYSILCDNLWLQIWRFYSSGYCDIQGYDAV
jgi:hypothetical protein